MFTKLFDDFSAPEGVKTITYATAIRWIGWGFAESLIPIFIFTFSKNYAEAGLIRSSYDIAFIISLPIIGAAADRFRATTLIMIGLIAYTSIGLFYFLAGLTGAVVFIILARMTNGVTYALDSIGRGTYFRRNTPPEKLATIFGYFDTISNFWWVMASLAGMVLINYTSIHSLLLLITPTSLIALLMIWRFRKTDKLIKTEQIERTENSYKTAFKEISSWNIGLIGIAVFNFFIAVVSSVVGFFLPIQAYNAGAGLSRTILIGVMFTLPYILGWLLGKWFDVKGLSTFAYGLLGLALLLLSLALVNNYWWQLLAAFGVGIVLELVSVGNNELITIYSKPEHFGRAGSIMSLINDLGSLIGPLALGIMVDLQGLSASYFVLAAMMMVMAITFYIVQTKLKFAQFKPSLHLHHKTHRHI